VVGVNASAQLEPPPDDAPAGELAEALRAAHADTVALAGDLRAERALADRLAAALHAAASTAPTDDPAGRLELDAALAAWRDARTASPPRRPGPVDRIVWRRRPSDGDLGCVDEVVVGDVDTAHVEQLDGRCWWVGLYQRGGALWSGHFTVDDAGRLQFTQQESTVRWHADADGHADGDGGQPGVSP
jgi:hypothetical protein